MRTKLPPNILRDPNQPATNPMSDVNQVATQTHNRSKPSYQPIRSLVRISFGVVWQFGPHCLPLMGLCGSMVPISHGHVQQFGPHPLPLMGLCGSLVPISNWLVWQFGSHLLLYCVAVWFPQLMVMCRSLVLTAYSLWVCVVFWFPFIMVMCGSLVLTCYLLWVCLAVWFPSLMGLFSSLLHISHRVCGSLVRISYGHA